MTWFDWLLAAQAATWFGFALYWRGQARHLRRQCDWMFPELLRTEAQLAAAWQREYQRNAEIAWARRDAARARRQEKPN